VGEVLGDGSFFELLLSIDKELYGDAAKRPCPHCGGRLDQSHYPRKPRGGPEEVAEEFEVRFSLCCAADGCRKRLTPPSVRFIGRKVYVAAAVVLIAAAHQGSPDFRIERLSGLFGVPLGTIRRWLRWWCGRFAQSRLFQSLRGLVAAPLSAARLPLAFLEVLLPPAQASLAEATRRLLHLLLPITTATAPGALPI
jgi:hypothetical protein